MAQEGRSIKKHQVLLDTFVAKVKLSAALCRGDRFQVENYAGTLYRYTAGEYGHFTAAAAGESLAIKVLTQVVDYSTNELVVNALLVDRLFPGYSMKRLQVFLGDVLNRELPPILGDVSAATSEMICHEIWAIAMDANRRDNSQAVMLWKSLERENSSSALRRVVEEHASWIVRLVAEVLKSASR